MTVLEYLLEAERVMVAGNWWWVDGETNILRTFRREVFWSAIKSSRMRKQQLLVEEVCVCVC